MFFRKVITKRNGKEYTYLKLIESYREDGKIKQRVIANFGNIANLSPDKIESLIKGLHKFCEINIKNQAVSEKFIDYPELKLYRQRWLQLGLDKIFDKLPTVESSPFPLPLIAEIITLAGLFYEPAKLTPEQVWLSGFPESRDLRPSRQNYYHTLNHLGNMNIYHRLETDLINLSTDRHLFIHVIKSSFKGIDCTNPQILYLALIFNYQGTAIGVRLLNPVNLGNEIVTIATELKNNYQRTAVLIFDERHLSQNFQHQAKYQSIPVPFIAVRNSHNSADILPQQSIIRQIISKNIIPPAEWQQTLEQRISAAYQELKKIELQIASGRLKKTETIMKHINAALTKYRCGEYFNVSFDQQCRVLKYSIKHERLQINLEAAKTVILSSNLTGFSDNNITLLIKDILAQAAHFRNINDHLNVAKYCLDNQDHYPEQVIIGIIIVNLLGQLISNFKLKSANNINKENILYS